MVNIYCSFLSNIPSHFRHPTTGLNAIASHPFVAAEVQIDLFRTVRNSNGEMFTDDGAAPGPWLRARNVDAWAFLSVHWPGLLAQWGESTDVVESNPYWSRRIVAREIERNRWWIKDKDGNPVHGSMGEKRVLADMNNPDYRGMLLDVIGQSGARKLRFDDAMYHVVSYCRPQAVKFNSAEYAQGVMALYDALRSAGYQVVANGGWEMDSPDAYTYPLLAHVDGMMMEEPSGFARVDTGKWWGRDEDATVRIMQDWLNASKRAIYVAPYTTEGYRASKFANYDAHTQHYYDLARRASTGMEAWFVGGNDDGAYSATSQVWWHPSYGTTTPSPTTPPATADWAELKAWMREKDLQLAHIQGTVDALHIGREKDRNRIGRALSAVSAGMVDTVEIWSE